MTIYYRYSRQGKVFSNLLSVFAVTVTCAFFSSTTVQVLAFTRHLRLRLRTRPFCVDDGDDGVSDHLNSKTRLYQQPETSTPEGYPRVYNWYKNRTTEQIVPNPLPSSEVATIRQHRQQQLSTPPLLPLLPLPTIPAAQETWNWCRYFVVPYHLCPWAAASVQTPGAVSIYLINSQRDGRDTFVRAVQHVSHLFWTSMSNGMMPIQPLPSWWMFLRFGETLVRSTNITKICWTTLWNRMTGSCWHHFIRNGGTTLMNLTMAMH